MIGFWLLAKPKRKLLAIYGTAVIGHKLSKQYENP